MSARTRTDDIHRRGRRWGTERTMKKIQFSVNLQGNPLHEDDPKKAYGNIQLTGNVNLSELAAHITDHNSVFSKGTIVGILTELSVCIRELLLQGYSIELGEVGRFTPSIRSNPTDTLQEFTADNIADMHVNFTAGKALKNLRRDAQFEQTSSRAAQAAALRAAKTGATTADWTPNSNGGSGGGGSEPEPEP